ncbi:MAG: 2-oxo acid dehydrogenase subunit E2 [Deltaproteobacteria bacterium]|nr:2-oxo acid dehydrogenase subunit E2 [Deltaproteobacteria bacterium]MCW8893759.1 2-oxo acid dehydrogenase subunit E2 [Deltaproteobacteria bacterium]MCW9050492.1 2-oxo acid dehydrogenase subunit E2 [Deltaproteobacteria bacterium]
MSDKKIFALTIPKWGLTMEEGTISEWLLNEGDEVEIESEIVEIATDKINQPIESPVAGVLRRILGEEGEDYPVKELIGIIADADVSDDEIDAFITSYRDSHSVIETDEEDMDQEETVAEETNSPASTKPISKMRATIAKTVVSSWTIPQFPVTMAINMGKAAALRVQLKEKDQAISMNDIITRACANAIEKYPMVNAQLGDKEYILNSQINIAIAVAVDEDLMMPVIQGCEALSLKEVASRSRQLITMVKDGSIGEADLTGGNFAISNLGMFGVEQFAALVPPGMAAILAVGGIRDEVLVQDGKMIPAAIMRVTLMSDHRIVDGMYAANFLVELKRLLENPEEL